VYKTITKDQSTDNWQAVYLLVKDKDEQYVEVCHGHFNTLLVKEGDQVVEGQGIGLEGNKGYVMMGGQVITKAMQDKGDQRGTHTHTSYRPVRRVKTTNAKKHYLLAVAGTRYRDQEGFYYEIVHQTNKGYVDPLLYTHQNTIMEDIMMIMRLSDKLNFK
jgi:hypothetical protein